MISYAVAFLPPPRR